MSHLIDVLDEAGLRTGEVLSRTEIHRLGKIHRAVHLFIFNTNNELLMQRRSLTVDHAPGMYGISLTAHIDAGEFSASTVRREAQEELGVDASAWRIDFLFSYYQEAVLHGDYIDRQFNDVYITRADLPLDQIWFDSTEVSEVQYVTLDYFHSLVLDTSSLYAEFYGRAWRDMRYFLDDWFGR